MRWLNGKVFAWIENRALLDLRSHTNRLNDPVGIGVFAMRRCFGFGSSNIHDPSMCENPEKIKTSPKIDGTTKKTQKSPLILKDYFERKIVDNEKSIT